MGKEGEKNEERDKEEGSGKKKEDDGEKREKNGEEEREEAPVKKTYIHGKGMYEENEKEKEQSMGGVRRRMIAMVEWRVKRR